MLLSYIKPIIGVIGVGLLGFKIVDDARSTVALWMELGFNHSYAMLVTIKGQNHWLPFWHQLPSLAFKMKSMAHKPMPDQSALIAITARNIEPQFKGFVKNLTSIQASLDDYLTVIVIDDNADQTEHLLRQLVAAYPKMVLVKISNPKGSRTQRLSKARNAYLAIADQVMNQYRYLMVMDADLKAVDAPSVSSEIKRQAYQVSTANDVNWYYDGWALRTHKQPESCDHLKWPSCWALFDRWFDSTNSNQSLKTRRIALESEQIPVISAFGGLALYPSSAIQACRRHADCQYSAIRESSVNETGRPDDDCEHVYFHKQLSKYAGIELYIVPNLLVQHPDMYPKCTIPGAAKRWMSLPPFKYES
ncbi:MAG: hypothetical protein VXY77_00500 [Pseudomonadota bacterium]|nr:hypothetical protein [Pseudomonadota bacterium]